MKTKIKSNFGIVVQLSTHTNRHRLLQIPILDFFSIHHPIPSTDFFYVAAIHALLLVLNLN